MARRFGAWGRIIALFRALFLGVKAGKLHMPERRGGLFDPNSFAFLEGWDAEGSAPIRTLEGQTAVKLPTLDDETLFEVMNKLILLDGQRLSYRALDVEQIGSVYEGLMGYHVERVGSDAVCMRPDGVWCSVDQLAAVPPAQRAAWIADTIGLDKSKSKALAEAVKGLSQGKMLDVLEGYALGRSKEQRQSARVRAGQLVLQPGPERRRTSSHYTLRCLSTQVVGRALQPLLATMTPEGAEGPKSEQILQLRVCDPAMGSGAFLVEACRYLGDALEAAWRREGTLGKHRDPTLAARRRVAQCCLYGVDKNPMAVELAKLSLWLVTLEQARPFTFLDCSLRHGDSLVGLSLDQLRAFHWRPSKQLEIDAKLVGRELDEAIALRQRLIELALVENGVNPDPQEKALLGRDFEDAIERLRLVADVCVSAFFAADSDKAREQERLRRLEIVQRWLWETDGARAAELARELREMVTRLRQAQVPFHWMLEFPEVFWDQRPDPLAEAKRDGAFVDSIVGNPPFMGVAFMTEQLGQGYVPWLQVLHERTAGKFDLSAHFFRRAACLLGKNGTIGLIATNTIGQGDTRATGLQVLLDAGCKIYDAVTNMPWPTGDAAVTVSLVHLAKGVVRDNVTPQFAGVTCAHINSALQVGSERSDPSKLTSNDSGAFVGSYVLGMGFTLTLEERTELIKHNRRNVARIFPYLGGEEVNTNPTQNFDRYVINFGSMSLDEAGDWPDLLAVVREKVKPERDKVRREAHRKYWWHYADKRPALYEAIAPLKRCLVTACVTKHLVFSFQPTDRIFSHKLYVFPLDHHAAFATLQSRIHESWVWRLPSTLGTTLNYSGSDYFDTFPFPHADPRAQIPELEKTGQALYEARAQYMVGTNQGLTKTYNALKDPNNRDREILKIRGLHEAMDRAVLDTYGWHDLAVPPFCPKTADDQAQLKRFESEVIDRLYALNAERAAEEERLGLTSRAKPKSSAKRTKKHGDAAQLESLALSAGVVQGASQSSAPRAKSKPPSKASPSKRSSQPAAKKTRSTAR